jgi:hypothetical protein
LTLIVTVAVPSLASVPSVQVTVPVSWAQVPFVLAAET